MRLFSVAFCAGLIAASLATTPCADATTVKHFDLGGMTASAARVFRGTVTDVRAGTVSVGGGQLATTIYRIRVTETFKGEFATVKDITYADVNMIGSIKADAQGTTRATSHFPRHAAPRARAGVSAVPDRREPRRALEPGRARARPLRHRHVGPERADGQPREQRRPGCRRARARCPMPTSRNAYARSSPRQKGDKR